jgi:hypothetical protein
MAAVTIGAPSKSWQLAKDLIADHFIAGSFPAHIKLTNRVNRKLVFPEMPGLLLGPVGSDYGVAIIRVDSLASLHRLASSIELIAEANQYLEMVTLEQFIYPEDLKMITYTLDDTILIVPMGGIIRPITVTLKSAAAGRKLEVSTDGGEEYFALETDETSATQLVACIDGPVTHLKATGAANDLVKLVN